MCEKRLSDSTLRYPLPPPNSIQESGRLGVQHRLSLADLDGALLLSPFPPPQDPAHDTPSTSPRLRVADIGTGTGIWAVDFARRHPEIQVVGIDLAMPLTPSPSAGPIPPNVRFAIHNVESPWPTSGPAAGPFDLVYGRQILLNLHDPLTALRHAHASLRPGGFIEFREFWSPMGSEVLDRDPSSAVPLIVEWSRYTTAAAAAMGANHEFAERLPQALRDAGFVHVTVSDRKVPMGGWTLDNQQQDARTREMDGLLTELTRLGALGMTKEMYPRGLGWTEEAAETYAGRVVDELDRTDLADDRVYATFRLVWARKEDKV